jgi:quercetin dioxygenase-like cupin family protein
MKIVPVNEVSTSDNPHKIDARKLYDHDNAQVVHICFSPGEALKPHITPTDVFFYVLEGAIDIQVGDETVTVSKDNLVESPKDIVHCLYNNSRSVARVLVVKAPKPTAASKMV